MSEKELGRIAVMARVQSGDLKLIDGARLMGVCYRQAKRIHRDYREQGAAGLKHGNAGEISHNARPREEREEILSLVREHYSGGVGERFGPTLAAEHLEREQGRKVHAETLRRWMLGAGLWSRVRKRKPYRQRRERRLHFGELVQMDGSHHGWLEERGPRGCLMNMVDDATAQAQMQFAEQETIWAAVAGLRSWIARYGVPLALYVDWKNIYVRSANAQERVSGEEPVTQFGRMCTRLGIRIIAASSPQAKGRVERAHGTHQDRLVKKLRVKKISSYEQANRFLEHEYVEEHNQRYWQAPAQAKDYHRPAPSAKQLQQIFRLQQERTIGNDWVVRYHNRYLQLQRQSQHYAPAQAKVTVCEWEDGRLAIEYRGRELKWREIDLPTIQSQREGIRVAKTASDPTLTKQTKPALGPGSPWRQLVRREIREQQDRKQLREIRKWCNDSLATAPSSVSP